MNPRIRALGYLHTAVFLWGFTAILGKLISYGSIQLVWHRMLLTAAVYFCIPLLWKHLGKMSMKEIVTFLGIGVIVCAHWLTFYGSIKLGNSASITLACLGTASFFASVLEPVLTKQPFKRIEILLGTMVLGGMLLIYFSLPPTDSAGEANFTAAIVTGVISAFLAALFTVLNKINIHKTDPLALSALEMLSGAAVLTFVVLIMPDTRLVFPGWNPEAGNLDLLWIVLLVVLCTNLTFWLGSHALKELSAFTANLTVNLEPVYGIILGAVIFHEHQSLNIWFYMGSLLILISVFAQSVVSYRLRKKNPTENTELIIRE